MCVIVASYTGRPTEDDVARMWEKNSHGGGASWAEDGITKWKKGLTVEQMQELAATLPFPFMLHFRLASQGTSKEPQACHPFPILPGVPDALEGESRDGVVFHNGFWSDWKDSVLQIGLLLRYEVIRAVDVLPTDPFPDGVVIREVLGLRPLLQALEDRFVVPLVHQPDVVIAIAE